ncbi:hypothetical protein KJ765_05935 [Candidatus Micrarchaeota archaeon]|nr:hypothetical protein [Candidatus Micrarchaeota archaeon]
MNEKIRYAIVGFKAGVWEKKGELEQLVEKPSIKRTVIAFSGYAATAALVMGYHMAQTAMLERSLTLPIHLGAAVATPIILFAYAAHTSYYLQNRLNVASIAGLIGRSSPYFVLAIAMGGEILLGLNFALAAQTASELVFLKLHRMI